MPLVEALPDGPPPNLASAAPGVAHEDARDAIHSEAATLLSRNAAEPNLYVPQYQTQIELQNDAYSLGRNAVGWSENPEEVPHPIIKGLPNDNLWMLIRRFNGQMYHVKAIDTVPAGQLDLEVSANEEFSPDKLRANIERLYITVFLGMAGGANHIARLRSWNERKRSAAFAAGYLIAWLLDLLIPAILLLVIVLIVHPPSRPYLFPPAPLAAINAKTGNVQVPKAGSLESTDSLTGASEKHKGEAAEREASNFVTGLATIAVGSAVGKKEDAAKASKAADAKIPDPVDALNASVDAQQNAAGTVPAPANDHTKQPMQDSLWKGVRPIVRALSDLADGWERFGNALSPTPPFKDFVRLKLAGVIMVLFFVSLVITPYMISKGIGAGIGLGLFMPHKYAMQGWIWLNKNYPNWPDYVALKNTLLKGVPTNAQLTLTLLRLGEAEKTPLPPPPRYADSPPEAAPEEADVPSDYEIESVDETDTEGQPGFDGQGPANKKPKEKTGHKVVTALKTLAKGGVNTGLGVEKIKAVVTGSEHAKQRLGALPSEKEHEARIADVYQCRYRGKRGQMLISTSATTPCIAFKFNKLTDQDKAEFSIQLADITSIRKLGGFGFKTKLVVGYVLNKEVADGIELYDSDGGIHVITAMQRRDEAFNRLVAIAGQKWESY